MPSNGMKYLIKKTIGINKRLVPRYFIVVLEKIEKFIPILLIARICKMIIKTSDVAVVIIHISGVSFLIKIRNIFIKTL